jgi:GDP-4-dehydro-6-deoxy-D-mannose reductase
MLIMNKGCAGEVYNLGSGVTYSMGEVLDRLLTLSGVRCEVRQRRDLMRDAETTVLCADASKARRELGWQPGFTLEKTLADILAYWRQAL